MPLKVIKYSRTAVLPIISKALEEDIGRGDITSLSVLPKGAFSEAAIIAKEEAVACGLDIISWLYGLLSKKIKVKKFFKDGERIKKGEVVCSVKGPSLQILMGERVALNFISHMSGIATVTREFADKLGPEIDVLDTRKTHPNLRLIQKYAVKIGGGKNHRMGLYDQVLIKDNHIDIIAGEEGIDRRQAAILALKRAEKLAGRGVKIEIEIDDENVFEAVLEQGADIAMLDNMPINRVRNMARALKKHHPGILIEVSGKLSKSHINKLKSIKEIDRVSLGRITHSFKIVDYSMEIR